MGDPRRRARARIQGPGATLVIAQLAMLCGPLRTPPEDSLTGIATEPSCTSLTASGLGPAALADSIAGGQLLFPTGCPILSLVRRHLRTPGIKGAAKLNQLARILDVAGFGGMYKGVRYQIVEYLLRQIRITQKLTSPGALRSRIRKAL